MEDAKGGCNLIPGAPVTPPVVFTPCESEAPKVMSPPLGESDMGVQAAEKEPPLLLLFLGAAEGGGREQPSMLPFLASSMLQTPSIRD